METPRQSQLVPIPVNWNHSNGIYTGDIIPKFKEGDEDESFTVKWYQDGINKFGQKKRNTKLNPGTSVFDQLTEDEFETLIDRVKKYKNNKIYKKQKA